MATKNDEQIIKLKELVDKKREEIKKIKKPTFETNLVLDLEGQKYNLNVLGAESLKMLKVRLNMYRLSMKDLSMNIPISGYSVEQWLADISNKISCHEYKKHEKDLEETEKKLNALLSEDKKVELELNELAKSLGLN